MILARTSRRAMVGGVWLLAARCHVQPRIGGMGGGPAGGRSSAHPDPTPDHSRGAVSRLTRARELMQRQGIGAVHRRDRDLASTISPESNGGAANGSLALSSRHSGDPIIVTPFFERPSITEMPRSSRRNPHLAARMRSR